MPPGTRLHEDEQLLQTVDIRPVFIIKHFLRLHDVITSVAHPLLFLFGIDLQSDPRVQDM